MSKKIDKHKTLFGLLVMFFAASFTALAQVEQSGQALPSASTLQSQPQVTEIQLPQHWQEYWLDEPIFNNKVHVVEAGNKAGPTLLLVHGLGYSGLLDWLKVIPELEDDYHIITLDLPGFGQSDPTALQLGPLKYAALLAWLVPQFSQQPVTIIGHSMGGAISLRFAASHPSLVNKLIMVDTAGVLQRSVFVLHMTQVPNHYAWLEPYSSKFKPLDNVVTRVSNFINRWRISLISSIDRYPDPAKILLENEFAQRFVYKDRATLNAALGLVYEDLSSAIEQLTIPSHIIWGRNDRVAPLRTGKLLARQLKNAQLHIIDDAGHVPMQDQTEQFVAILKDTLTHEPIKQNIMPLTTNALQNYTCSNQNELELSGVYNNISLTNCQYINLRNVQASNISSIDSIINIEDSSFNSFTTALISIRSRVTMTNVNLTGERAMIVDDSLIDSAGVVFRGGQQAIKIESKSQLYFSVSSQIKNGQESHLHGMSMGRTLELE